MKLGIDIIKDEMIKHLDTLQEEHNALLEKYNNCILERDDVITERNKIILEKDKAIIEKNEAINTMNQTFLNLEKLSTENEDLQTKVNTLEENVRNLSYETTTQKANHDLLNDKLSRVTLERDAYFQNSQKLENEKIKLADSNKVLSEKLDYLQNIDAKCAQLEGEKAKLTSYNTRLASEMEERLKIDAEKTALSGKLNEIIKEFQKKVDELEHKGLSREASALYQSSVASIASVASADTAVATSGYSEKDLGELEHKLEEAIKYRDFYEQELAETKDELAAQSDADKKEKIEESIKEIEDLRSSWIDEVAKIQNDIEAVRSAPPIEEVVPIVLPTASDESVLDNANDNQSEEANVVVAPPDPTIEVERKLLKSIQHRELIVKRLDEAKRELRNEYGFENIQMLKAEIKELDAKKAIEDERIVQLEAEIKEIQKNNPAPTDEPIDSAETVEAETVEESVE